MKDYATANRQQYLQQAQGIQYKKTYIFLLVITLLIALIIN